MPRRTVSHCHSRPASVSNPSTAVDMPLNPLSESAPTDFEDAELVSAARGGSADALEQLVLRHQRWIYNIVRRMSYNPVDAEDATQEILIKVITKLSTFEARSSFRTWLYRIVVNHVLNRQRSSSESAGWTFERYHRALQDVPDAELPEDRTTPADRQVLVQEAKIACTTGVLLCLDREQRLVYILGEIFDVRDRVGADLLEISRANFRQKLSRARRDLHRFLQNQCGLVNPDNPCRCAKKTHGFIEAGYVNAERLVFVSDRMTAVREVAPRAADALEQFDERLAGLFRDHPFHDTPDFVARLKPLFTDLGNSPLMES